MWTTCWPISSRRLLRSDSGAGWRAALLAAATLSLTAPLHAAEPAAAAAVAPPVAQQPDTPPHGLLDQVKGVVQGTWQGGVGWLAGGKSEPLVLEQGSASFLANALHGRKTASGERYDMNELTAAHKTLPFGTRVIVRSLQTGREVAVRITDRGPHLKSRIIDLSHAAASALGIKSAGVSQVQIVEPETSKPVP
jgi:rare lipoprotein A